MYNKVVVLDSVIFYPEHRDRLNKIAKEVVEYNTCASESEVLERTKGADCIISCWVDIPDRVIDENPQLKTVAFWTHAYEHRINKRHALERDIYVPSIPDYGTDSVAELVFIGLLQLYGRERVPRHSAETAGRRRTLQEEIVAHITDDIRRLNRNWKDNLQGSWMHEYIKAGQLKITSPDEIKEETLKGLTVGLLVGDRLREDLLEIVSSGFQMNAIYSLGDLPHSSNIAYRPIDNLLRESHVVIYDSTLIGEDLRNRIAATNYLSKVDVSKLAPIGNSLRNRKMGIVGLGRIGGRVAQIARDGFNMHVTYFSRTRKPDLEKQYQLEYLPLERLLSEFDIVTFHLPHIGAERFITNEMVDSIPPGRTVVNVSVGSIFEDQTHFLNRFKAGDLIGYVDVYETLPPRSELRLRQDCLISTYRLGWRTKSTVGLKTHKLITKLEEGLHSKDNPVQDASGR